MTRTVAGRTYPPMYRFIEAIARPAMALYTKAEWSGGENLPRTGGFVAVSNHVTNIDALTFAHFMVGHDIPVKFLAKSELFQVPVLGSMIGAAHQIEVKRGTRDAQAALSQARRALRAGECVGIFPEGTLTRDPDMWPMKAKTGAARLALETGVPVIPVAQWGTQDVIERYGVKPKLGIKHPVQVMAMPAVDLADLRQEPLTAQVAREATVRIMADLTRGVAELRGEEPPSHVWDIAIDGDPRPKKGKAS
ncbi:1-acyl-sn-glycerol-3-phosphate acyltransferases [Bowdeniella nasicola]|uniref:1-acyl-sn-glycerol-3-phosphate acyltransferases n=1 Tax=Bowdeniella nasicola TaxID=208480 RepID=A0A1H4C3D0_9ACTO|nr:lysophospholipid acyltransferase family protein [Bowdeniella nasicola]SEA54837.1 1-acyl-sn-glycerol-3-phosphate acyltransferases [Bowdeniella nasicola]